LNDLSLDGLGKLKNAIIVRNPKSGKSMLPKAKAPTSPKVDALTLQSQFSQGESMNERILNPSGKERVAKTLRSNCEGVSVACCQLAQTASLRTWFSLTQGLKKNKTLSNLLGSEAYRG